MLSFRVPSSHVLFYTVFWGFLLYLSLKYKKENKLFYTFIEILSGYFIVFIGVSRIVLNAHYLKDVIGGYIFGLIFLFTLILIDKKTQNMLTKNNKKDK